MIAWAITNIAIIISFAGLAIWFEKWWIVLFAALFTYGYRDKGAEEQKEATTDDQ